MDKEAEESTGRAQVNMGVGRVFGWPRREGDWGEYWEGLDEKGNGKIIG